MTKNFWTISETQRLIELKGKGLNAREIAEQLDRPVASVTSKYQNMLREGLVRTPKVPPSSMPVWDKPLKSEGDALILTDVEAPFQHSDFINRCLDLADHWGVNILHLAGDLLHYDNLSKWGSEWVEDKEDLLERIMDVVDKSLKERDRAKIREGLEKAGVVADTSLSGELTEARKVFKAFTNFKEIYVALGNHDDRYLRALDRALSPHELLHQLDVHLDPRYKIAPYYYTLIETCQGLFRAEHPRPAGKNAAVDLAIQYHCHVVMGHSHRWAVNRDPSGKFWAIQTGHCVDETRLAYVMQRAAKRDAHVLGATIIRDGYPFVLSPETPWDIMKRM